MVEKMLGFTPVELVFEIEYRSTPGHGRCEFSMSTFWPGVPQVGQTFCNDKLNGHLLGPWVVKGVDVLHYGGGDMQMHVVFETHDVSILGGDELQQYDEHLDKDRKFFAGLAQQLENYGFEIDSIVWWPCGSTEDLTDIVADLKDDPNLN